MALNCAPYTSGFFGDEFTRLYEHICLVLGSRIFLLTAFTNMRLDEKHVLLAI